MADAQKETNTPDQIAPKPPQLPVMFQDRARIEWLDAEGNVVNKELCLRGLGPLVDRLTREKLTDEQKHQRVRITLLGDPGGQSDADGNPVEVTAVDDEWEKVALHLARNMIDPRLVILNYQKMSEQMAERGDLKAIIFTAVFEGARAAGIGFMSSVAEVTDADLVTLVEASENQISMFKDAVRKQRPAIKFKSDKEPSRIILPH